MAVMISRTSTAQVQSSPSTASERFDYETLESGSYQHEHTFKERPIANIKWRQSPSFPCPSALAGLDDPRVHGS